MPKKRKRVSFNNLGFGFGMRAARLRRGYTIEALAQRIGMRRKKLRKFEIGRFEATDALLEKIATVYQMPATALKQEIEEKSGTADLATKRARSAPVKEQEDDEDGRVFARATYYIEPEQFKAIKLRAVNEGRNASDLVREALNSYLGGTEATNPIAMLASALSRIAATK